MDELGAGIRVERRAAHLDEPGAQVDMAEQAPFRALPEAGPRLQLDRPPDVVQQRRGDEQVGAEPRMELAELAADRRDADRVLEEPAGVVVVAVRRSRERTEPSADLGIVEEPGHAGAQPGMSELAGEIVEEAVELVRVAAKRRRQAG